MSIAATDSSIGTAFSDISAALIEENYRQLGCSAWNRPRFQRLCGKLQRTPREMAAFLRIQPRTLEKRLQIGFRPQDGLILTMLDREIETISSGKAPTRGMFLMAELKKKSP